MHDRIEINRRIHHGQPVIKGTRVPVTRILAEIASGSSFERIQQQYDLTAADIRAAVAFANELVEHLDKIVRITPPAKRQRLRKFQPIEMPGGSLADELIRDRR